jgi:hypothetical protein
MTHTLSFNTGRKYAPHGQPITAARDPATGDVAFVDHGRMIEGIIRGCDQFSQTSVIAAYDARKYEMPREADRSLVAAAWKVPSVDIDVASTNSQRATLSWLI